MKKVTLEQKKEAVRIAIKGGDPVNYLRVCGSRDPGQMWAMIRAKLRKDNPEIFLKLPKPEVKQKEEAPEQCQVVKTANGMMHNINRNPPPPPQPPEQVPTVKVDGPIRIQTEEPEKVNVLKMEAPEKCEGEHKVLIADEITAWCKEQKKPAPLQYDGYTVCCIESKTFGRFYWDRDHNYLDWTTAEGEEVSFTPAGWKMFLEELPKVAKILGVDI